MQPDHDLSIEYRERHDGHIRMRSVALLVDGEDQVASLGAGGYIGLEPADLVAQRQLIEPSTSPHEVTLYCCDCGELGCGAVVARCYRVKGCVVWDQFGWGNPPPRDLDAPQPASDALVFDAEQYWAAMSRLTELAARHS
jgi:hypothetical protein